MKAQAYIDQDIGTRVMQSVMETHGIVGNWRFVVGKVEFALSVIIPHLRR